LLSPEDWLNLRRENGKTKIDAIGDVTRGIEVVEHSLAMPTLMMGDAIEQISNNMDTKSFRQVESALLSLRMFEATIVTPRSISPWVW
jgi:hypothetical protein